ncbi:MAG: bifunctional diaminohydroxyphosphoribosylaminopyrimidine deaminase/5-amino-6-(5-phosphoribosylamino)uracil reductase RibD [Paludibacteraceae bacterium]|nr:bifunctional diaminohydroxyphosphoribosylaminopyrimidine deaminase/5-amino-6-(5-phosphoribosylamino)uracil reductase RibD [Paludibacteraceae bacterium]
MENFYDLYYMKRCLALAAKGIGKVAPNPMVGCVIVYNNNIIGEGYHRCYGGPHAEVNALDSVKDKSLLKDSTLYVNLEPCSHYGKTPPCAERIIKEGIRKVVVCNLDPNPDVNGKGLQMLRDAGIEVITGILEKDGLELNRCFFTFHTKHRPYIILKWAQTKDGFIDDFNNKPLEISNNLTKALVHKMRAENMGIMVGTRTALKDNPHLNTRRWYGKNCTRVIIDKRGEVPSDNKVFDSSAPTVVIDREMTPNEIGSLLYSKGIQSLIVEGGNNTLERFITSGLYDEVHLEINETECGDGVKAPNITLPDDSIEAALYGSQTLISWRNISNA